MKRFLRSTLSIVLALTIILSSAAVGLRQVDFGCITSFIKPLVSNFSVLSNAVNESALTFTLSVDETYYSVTDCNTDASGDLVIPKEYNGLPVTSIGYMAFTDCVNITSVKIPDSVTRIGGCSFIGCTNLKTISLPDSVEYIGESVFYDTAFYNDKANWDNGVLYLNNHLVAVDCNVVEGEYFIKNGTITVASYAFYGCNKLTKLVFPDSLKYIKYEALLECDELSEIDVSDKNNNFSYSNGVLYNGDCSEIIWYSLKNTQCDFEIPDSLKYLDFWVFYGNNCLNKIIVSFNSKLNSISYSNDEVNQYEIEYGCNKESLFSDIRVKNKMIIHDISSEWTIDEKATCTQTGVKSHHCNYCDLVTDETVIPEQGHRTGEWVVEKEPTCTMDGIKMQYCTECEDILNVEKIQSKGGHTSSDWIVDTEASVYAAGSQHKECTVCGKVLEREAIPQLKPAASKLTSVTNSAKGVTVKWGAVEGADNYNVYRKTYNATTKKWSGWSRIKKGTTSTSYTDTTAKSGTYYRYTVIANNEAGSSKYDTTGLKIYFLSTPKLTSIANNTGKVTVKWNKVSGATGYFVYRRTYNATTKTWGGWTRIAKTKSNAYNDTTAKSGVYYRYTVRAYYGSYASYFNTTGLQTKFLATPTLKATTSTKAGVKVTWGKVSGSSGYYVYRKTYSGGEWTGWKRIAKVSGGSKVSYLDESTKPGVYYKYTVRAYSGNYASWYNGTGLKIKAKY